MTFGAALTSDEDEVRRIASDIDGVRERSEGDEADRKATADRDEAAEGRKRERDDDERLRNSLGEVDRRRYGIIYKIKGFRRSKDNLNQRMEDIGL